MGTSTSSKGPKGGSPLVPPWVGDADKQDGSPPNQDGKISPPARFIGSRKNLGKYIKTGDKGSMQRGLGQYVSTGYGGAKTLSRRMAKTSSTASSLSGILSNYSGQTGTDGSEQTNKTHLQGKTTDEIASILANEICPSDSLPDTDIARKSVLDAFSDILNDDPNTDLLDLAPDQIDQIIERYIANDICNRLEWDGALATQSENISPAQEQTRIDGMREYIREEVGRIYRQNSLSAGTLTSELTQQLFSGVLEKTLSIFEAHG